MKWLSPAKINLTLLVGGVQADGFHALDSVVVPLSLNDEIILEKSGRLKQLAISNEQLAMDASSERELSPLSENRSPLSALRTNGASSIEVVSETVDLSAMPADGEKNLAMRALRLLEYEVGRALPTRIVIKKVIPLGGGLGGGSSNAATVLRGVNALWNLGLSTERLCALGAQLGSDVAQFVLDGLVRMRGRGELVERLDASGMEPMWVVLANCGAHCSTPAVYRAFDTRCQRHDKLAISNEQLAMDASPECELSPLSALRSPPSIKGLTNGGGICDTLCLSLRKGKVEAVASTVRNDLEVPCYGLFPEVARTAEALRAAGCTGVTLCGSGATVFGLVRSREEGEKALAHPALAGCWRACVQTLPDGVMAAHGPLTPIVMVRIHVGQP